MLTELPNPYAEQVLLSSARRWCKSWYWVTRRMRLRTRELRQYTEFAVSWWTCRHGALANYHNRVYYLQSDLTNTQPNIAQPIKVRLSPGCAAHNGGRPVRVRRCPATVIPMFALWCTPGPVPA